MLKPSLEQKDPKNLVLVFSEPTWPEGALLTPEAYSEFLTSARRPEVQTHASAIIELELAHLLDKPVVNHNNVLAHLFKGH